MNQYLGEICVFGFNFNPRDWQLCAGQTINISQNAALFALLGTYYGGNGTSTFGLPNLQGRAALHAAGGPGPGLPAYTMGDMEGVESVTITLNNMPAHSHNVSIQVNGNNSGGSSTTAPNQFPAGTGDGTNAYNNSTNATMAGATVSALANAGAGLPFSNLQPYLVMNYCIAMAGQFPTRS